MQSFKSEPGRAVAIAVALTTLATPALAQERFDWGGGRSGERDYRLIGAGVSRLLPELKRTPRGRAFVMRNFDRNQDGRVSSREAEDSNRALLLVAGGRRDRFDWESRDVVDRPAVRNRDWDRRGMRGYQMRQTRHGATFDLQDADRRPHPFGGRRFRQPAPFGAPRERGPGGFELDGRRGERLHGRGPWRDDAYGEQRLTGRQLNRRVEVTLVGQQARSFSE